MVPAPVGLAGVTTQSSHGGQNDAKLLSSTAQADAIMMDRDLIGQTNLGPPSPPPRHLPAADLTSDHTFFEGGYYVARKKPTCGGTGLGLPCVFGAWHPDNTFEPEWNRCSYAGSLRPWCYTSMDRSSFGYCDYDAADASEDGWTRPVGHLSTFHNAGRGAAMYICYRRFTSSIVGLLYEARPQATRLRVNTSLCIQSERHPFVDNEAFEMQASSNPHKT